MISFGSEPSGFITEIPAGSPLTNAINPFEPGYAAGAERASSEKPTAAAKVPQTMAATAPKLAKKTLGRGCLQWNAGSRTTPI